MDCHSQKANSGHHITSSFAFNVASIVAIMQPSITAIMSFMDIHYCHSSFESSLNSYLVAYHWCSYLPFKLVFATIGFSLKNLFSIVRLEFIFRALF